MAKKKSKVKKILGALAAAGTAAALMRGKRNRAIDAGIAAADEEPGAQIKNYGPYKKSNLGNTAPMFDYGDAFGYLDVGFKKGGLVKKGKPKLAKKGWK